jgi:thiol reductant ABC exporter CydC subunit
MNSTLRRLLELSGMSKRRVALSVGLAALTVVLGVGLIATAGYLISRAAEHPPILSLSVTIAAVRFFGLSRPLARYLDRLVSHDLALRSLGRIRARFFARIEPLAPAQLEGFRRGDLVSRMVGDVDALQGLYLRGIGPPAAALVVGMMAVTAAALMLPVAGLILAAGLVVGGVGVPLLTAALSRSAGERQTVERGALSADLVELLRGAPELVLYGREDERLEGVAAADRELARSSRRDALVAGLGTGLVVLVTGLTTVGVLAAAVAAHSAGSLDRVLVATVTLLALASFEAVGALPGAAQELAATLAAGHRVLELIDRRPVVTDPATPIVPPPMPAVVTLESVTARYAPDGPAVLERLDLRIEPGRRVAVVGENGAGKTTVTNLLFRFLDPESGRVTIGGQDVTSMRQEDVRRTFALAGQEAHVFDSTIRENLLLARPEAQETQLVQALERARLAEWVTTLPLGLDTLVGEEGSRLSGGQRQRLVLARALLVDAPVLVLDEPTAHLDPETATELMYDVFAATSGQSILLITHRREGLDLVDEIVELPGDRIGARKGGKGSPATSGSSSTR